MGEFLVVSSVLAKLIVNIYKNCKDTYKDGTKTFQMFDSIPIAFNSITHINSKTIINNILGIKIRWTQIAQFYKIKSCTVLCLLILI